MKDDTIDKIKFEVTIPIIIGIISIVVLVCGGYYFLLASIADVNARVAQVYVTVQAGIVEQQKFQDKLDDHEDRIRKLEYK